MNLKRDFRYLASLTVLVVAIQLIISTVIAPYLGTSVQNIYSISLSTGVTSLTIGNSIIAFLTGIIPIGNVFGSLYNIIAILLGAFLLVLSGYYIYGLKFTPKGRNIFSKLALILLYGTIVLYAFLMITNIGAVSALTVPLAIGLLVDYAIITSVIIFLAKVPLIGKFIRI